MKSFEGHLPLNDSDWFRKDDDVRWQFGVPPRGNANFAWVQHFIHHLAPHGGIAGFVLANGSMSTHQSGDGDIRRALIEADLEMSNAKLRIPNSIDSTSKFEIDRSNFAAALPGQLFHSTPRTVVLLLAEKILAPRQGTGRKFPDSSKGSLESLPVGSVIRITLVVCLVADLDGCDRVNLPEGKALRLPFDRLSCVSIRNVQIVIEETAFDQKQLSAQLANVRGCPIAGSILRNHLDDNPLEFAGIRRFGDRDMDVVIRFRLEVAIHRFTGVGVWLSFRKESEQTHARSLANRARCCLNALDSVPIGRRDLDALVH
jgi:hypothetical protein